MVAAAVAELPDALVVADLSGVVMVAVEDRLDDLAAAGMPAVVAAADQPGCARVMLLGP